MNIIASNPLVRSNKTAGQTAEDRLYTALKTGRFPHALIVACPDDRFAEALCRRAAAFWCTGEWDAKRLKLLADYTELGEEPLRMDKARELISELQKRPFAAGGRCVYIRNSHTMSEPVQNALLKTLEEPPSQTLFLFTGNEQGLLPTIRSRCGRFLYPAPTQKELALLLMEYGAGEKDAGLYAAWGGTAGRSLRLYEDEAFRTLRQDAQQLLKELILGKIPLEGLSTLAKEGEEAVAFMLSLLRDILLARHGVAAAGNPEQQAETASLCRRFTSGRITCIINILAGGMERLRTNASVHSTLISLFTQIAEEIS